MRRSNCCVVVYVCVCEGVCVFGREGCVIFLILSSLKAYEKVVFLTLIRTTRFENTRTKVGLYSLSPYSLLHPFSLDQARKAKGYIRCSTPPPSPPVLHLPPLPYTSAAVPPFSQEALFLQNIPSIVIVIMIKCKFEHNTRWQGAVRTGRQRTAC